MRRGRLIRIDPRGLHLQVDAHWGGGLFLKPGDIRRIEVFNQRVRQGQAGFIVPLEFRRLECDRLLQALANLHHHIAGHLASGVSAQSVAFLERKRQVFPFLFGELSSHLLLQLLLLASSFGLCSIQFLKVGAVEWFSQFLQIQTNIVGRSIFGQDVPVAVQNAASHRRHAHSAERLGFKRFLILTCRNYLNPPQPHQ